MAVSGFISAGSGRCCAMLMAMFLSLAALLCGRTRPLPVGGCIECRQFAQESDHSPDFLIVVRRPPGWHCGQLDAMLDHPKGLRWIVYAVFGQLGRLGVQTWPDFRVGLDRKSVV